MELWPNRWFHIHPSNLQKFTHNIPYCFSLRIWIIYLAYKQKAKNLFRGSNAMGAAILLRWHHQDVGIGMHSLDLYMMSYTQTKHLSLSLCIIIEIHPKWHDIALMQHCLYSEEMYYSPHIINWPVIIVFVCAYNQLWLLLIEFELEIILHAVNQPSYMWHCTLYICSDN